MLHEDIIFVFVIVFLLGSTCNSSIDAIGTGTDIIPFSSMKFAPVFAWALFKELYVHHRTQEDKAREEAAFTSLIQLKDRR